MHMQKKNKKKKQQQKNMMWCFGYQCLLDSVHYEKSQPSQLAFFINP